MIEKALIILTKTDYQELLIKFKQQGAKEVINKSIEITKAYLCKYFCRKNEKVRLARDGILNELEKLKESEE